MGKKRFFNFKNLFLVTFLAAAGFFSYAAVSANIKSEESFEAEETKAAISGTTLYFENYWNYSEPHVHYWGGSSSSTWPGPKMTDTSLDFDWDSTKRDIYYVTVASGTTTVKFSDNGNNGDGDHAITNGANMMIQRSHKWVYWDGITDCWRGQTRTIYFTRQGWEYWTTNYVHSWNVGQDGSTWGSDPSMTSIGEYTSGGKTYYLASVDVPAYCCDFIFKNAAGDTDKRVQTSLALNATATVYDGDAAAWKSYITYDKNGGTGTNTFSVTGSSESLKSFSDCGFTAPANKEFKGWATSPSGPVVYADGATYSGGNTTLYAVWDYKVHTITLNNQSATSAGTTTIYEKYNTGYYKDSSCTQKMTTSAYAISVPTKTGYDFGGYYTETGGSGTQYIGTNGYLTNSASTTKFTAAGSLYAKWTPKVLTITLDNQSATSAGTGSIYEKYNTGYYLESGCVNQMTTSANGIIVPSKTGYTFGGYYTETGGSGTQYIGANGKLTSSAVTTHFTATGTLYAKWTAKSSALTFNLNGGSGTAATGLTATYGSAMPTYTQSAPTKTGYIFSGFYDGEGGTDTKYYNADLSSAQNWDKNTTSGTTLYAGWTAKTCKLVFDLDYGSGPAPTNLSATYGQPMPKYTSDAPWRNPGYTFGGYYTEKNGGGTCYYTAGLESANTWAVDTTSDTTLYAYWIAKTTTVTFNKNGGEGGSDGFTATYDAAVPDIDVPTKAGYTFQGYYTEGDYQVYTSTGRGGKIWADESAEVTLYAHWNAISYAVTITGGTGISSVYLSTNASATSGSASGTKFNMDSTVYGFVVLEGGYAHASASWTLVSGTADTEGAIYRIGSLVVRTSGNDFGSIAGESGEEVALLFWGLFNDDLNGICEADGSTDPEELINAWNLDIVSEYNKLEGYEKYWLTNSEAASSLGISFARYDYILGKYGYTHDEEELDTMLDFLNRNPTSYAAIRNFTPFDLLSEDENTLPTAIIIIASSVSLLSVTALSILVIKKRKRKEQ